MADRKSAGEVDPVQIRKIGYRHAVVTPQRQSTVVDMNQLRVQRDNQRRQVRALERQLEATKAELAKSEAFLLAFDAQAVDRLEGDPEVPLEAPKPDPREPAPAPEPEPAEPAPAPETRG